MCNKLFDQNAISKNLTLKNKLAIHVFLGNLGLILDFYSLFAIANKYIFWLESE
jgi:hypothetical protein